LEELNLLLLSSDVVRNQEGKVLYSQLFEQMSELYLRKS